MYILLNAFGAQLSQIPAYSPPQAIDANRIQPMASIRFA